MKKMLFTAAIAFTSLIASAQFMVTANINLDDFDADEISETTDFGFGYFVNDTWVVGAIVTNDSILVEDGTKKEGNFKLFGRYYYNESLYISAELPTEEFADNLRLGAGYSFAAYGSFYVEPNFSFNVTADENNDDERYANFKLGLAYRF